MQFTFTPKEFRNKAQGCGVAATPGYGRLRLNPERCCARIPAPALPAGNAEALALTIEAVLSDADAARIRTAAAANICTSIIVN